MSCNIPTWTMHWFCPTTVHISAESHEITQLSSVLDVPIHVNLPQIKDFAISCSNICCNAQCSCFFLIGSIAIISIKQKGISYLMESYWDYQILLTTGWTNVKLMNCRRENHFQLAITTGQYSCDRCFTACCWDLPWGGKKNIMAFNCLKLGRQIYSSSQIQTAELCKIKHQPTLASFSSHNKHSSHFIKKLKKYILYRQIRYTVENNFLLFNQNPSQADKFCWPWLDA